MVGFRRIQMSLFLMLVLQLPAAEVAAGVLSSYVRVGDEVTLSCENVLRDEDNCDGTTWLYSHSRGTTVELIRLGQIGEHAKNKAARLSVTANCSVVIKKVTVEDVGLYSCQQYKAGKHQGSDSRVDLSLINVAEHENADVVTLSCSVTTYGRCTHSVEWLFQGTHVDPNNPDLKTAQSSCSASVTFQTDHFSYSLRYKNTFKCEVTDGNTRRKHLFLLRPQSAGEKPGEKSSTETGNITTTSTTNEASAEPQAAGVWRLIIVSVGLAALMITVVGVNIWTRATGRKTQMDENKEPNDEDDDTVNYENVTSSNGV
ncbi:uncharacterized protein [Pempheris klunzingeri]|uniref:uncharacterized protein isoform X2 n=1 Tax=Pempheris klunzingeri TaxID=3127111 RepID=UPI00398105A9